MPDDRQRSRLSSEERRAQLVALGVAALVDEPLEDITIDRLAADAGVSRGLLFHYFGTKQGLHEAIVRTARDAMLRATEPRPELAPLARLEDTLRRFVVFVADHRGTFHALVRGASAGDADVRALIDEARDENARRAIAVFLELGHEDGPLLRSALRSWVAFVEEMLDEVQPGDDRAADELSAVLVRTAVAVVAALDPVG
ncbi:TetR/AcrR family transcriptional regulator [Curtobacterium sp. 22159]|uniref:TetR/AcrR family transcriptional regulator n=1 Tax=Curtobacterium sp. 22159 TaxID=3453882 RepID=UPI003F8262D1